MHFKAGAFMLLSSSDTSENRHSDYFFGEPLNFDVVKVHIESLDDTESESDRDSFETDYFRLVEQVQNFIEKHSPNPKSITTITDSTNINQNSVGLPSINLPTFQGNYDEGQSFSDAFKSVIDINTSLNEMQKLYYLKSVLTGDSAAILHSLEGSAENYKTAWELLQSRYENKQYLVNKHVKALFGLNKVDKESAKLITQSVDNTQKHLRVLESLGQPTSQWDSMVIHLVTRQLHNNTFSEWEVSLKSDEIPTLKMLFQFLEQRCRLLEAIEDRNASVKHSFPKNIKVVIVQQVHANCVAKNNTLLHFPELQKGGNVDKPQLPIDARKGESSHTISAPPKIVSHSNSKQVNVSVMLSTAIMTVLDGNGAPHLCKVLSDSGSQSNFISKKMVQCLCLKTKKNHTEISGRGQSSTQTTQSTQCVIKSRVRSFSTTVDCIVLKNITQRLPTCSLLRSSVKILCNLSLADPKFFKPSHIDLLIGAEHFFHLITVGQLKPSRTSVVLQNNELGWIISGKVVASSPVRTTLTCNFAIEDKIDQQLQQFGDYRKLSTVKVTSCLKQNYSVKIILKKQ
ncbi:uncharacterized protein LOC142322754 [Lycorma delicatula]|uniref:uncharacterized protein LOC142322754 n=1 Tax=Lycorma delicatula TaxID=130591 RepID=UPI003F519756